MAIFNPGTGYSQPVVVDGTLFTNGNGGGTQAKASTNNRSAGQTYANNTGRAGAAPPIRKGAVNTSPFSELDNLITSLDATFETDADQPSWVTYAAAIENEWNLCANCQPDSGAKKLFRQYNFNRRLLGLTIQLVAPSGAPFADVGDIGVFWVIDDSTGDNFVSVDFDVSGNNDWLCIQIGKRLANPLFQLDPAINGVDFSSGPVYDFWTQLYLSCRSVPPAGSDDELDLFACVFTTDGAPGLKSGTPIVVDHFA